MHNIDNMDLFNLLGILLDSGRSAGEIRGRAIGYTRGHHVDRAVIMAAAGVVDGKIDYDALEQRGAVDMYSVSEETKIEGRAEEIIETGHEFGLSDEDILGKAAEKAGRIPGDGTGIHYKKP